MLSLPRLEITSRGVGCRAMPGGITHERTDLQINSVIAILAFAFPMTWGIRVCFPDEPGNCQVRSVSI